MMMYGAYFISIPVFPLMSHEDSTISSIRRLAIWFVNISIFKNFQISWAVCLAMLSFLVKALFLNIPSFFLIYGYATLD
ncbi:hypothetical protein T4B_2903 [Trichinella pseudospiralis]|uniref:Uncharacterized protein n=1 Tax=Trichinella pseudospiralis TaxID=6337 RepID=A0A0V1GXU8_TRIPS|nr:hypothetical protein T4B_1283 [Trichinella pseudospiralis]KRZ03115.1 hypothetical protein T4B_14996 [Trichinella pseudospiralis]KRZ03316.1 hypothetical protein T4B_2903 [Trichinella pseudospiralis]